MLDHNIATDNILGEISIGSGSAAMAQANGNLLRVGGSGKGNATDGADRGAAVAGNRGFGLAAASALHGSLLA